MKQQAELDMFDNWEEYHLPWYIHDNIDDFLLVDEAGVRPSEEFTPRSYFVDPEQENFGVRYGIWLRRESLMDFLWKHNDEEMFSS